DRAIHQERMRIARDLHDGVAQALAHLRFELDMISRDATPSDPHWNDIVRLGHVADRALNDLRSAVQGLRTAGTEGLVTTLRRFLDELEGPGMPELELTARGAIDVSDDVSGELFRVVQEAVSNAVRHARAHVIHVDIDAEDDDIVLTVEDDGVGIGPRIVRDTSSGVGLAAMRERAERIGATLDVELRASGGTRVRLMTGRRVRRLA
ncbi:MAG TPA: ATP-binding protein, partial [Actinomycetota bacterium]|nr:ATP-binding protein [Actinomycetota bacterium]